MNLNYLFLFSKVAELESFTGAAAVLGMTKSAVSAKVSQLEESLGTRLLQRTTRKVKLTEAGERVYSIVQTISDYAGEIEAVASEVQEKPQGTLRITAPHDLGFYLIDHLLPDFFRRYPDLGVEVDFSNSFVNLMDENFDLGLRASERPLVDSQLIAKPLGKTKLCLYSNRIGDHQRFTHPCDLEKAEGLLFVGFRDRKRRSTWTMDLTNGVEQATINVRGRFYTNDMLGLQRAVIGGLGIGCLPEMTCQKAVERGQLIQILPGWWAREAVFYAMLPGRRFLPTKTRVFVDYLTEALTNKHMISPMLKGTIS